MKRFCLFMSVLWILATTFTFSQSVVKRVLLEEFSTVPCGFCPLGGLVAEELLQKYPNLITFTHHAGFGTDSMTVKESITIAGLFTTFAPAAVIDRGHYKIPVFTDSNYIGISRQKWDSVVALRLAEEAEADIQLTNEFDPISRTLDVEVDVTFLKQMITNDFRLNIAIIEDSVTGKGKGYDQKNYMNGDPSYPTLYQKGDSIVGYVHRHVLRALPTGTWGQAGIIPGDPELNKHYHYKLSGYTIPDKWKIKDIKVIAFVSYYNKSKFSHKILNTVQGELNIVETDVTDQNVDDNSMIISPNPAKDYIEISVGTRRAVSEPSDVNIFNVLGEIQTTPSLRDTPPWKGGEKVRIDVSGLRTGLYFVRIGDKVQKFIKL